MKKKIFLPRPNNVDIVYILLVEFAILTALISQYLGYTNDKIIFPTVLGSAIIISLIGIFRRRFFLVSRGRAEIKTGKRAIVFSIFSLILCVFLFLLMEQRHISLNSLSPLEIIMIIGISVGVATLLHKSF